MKQWSDVHAVTVVKLLAEILSDKHDWQNYLAIDLIAELQKRIDITLNNE